MVREVRKVPAGWQHPSNGNYSNGMIRYDPLFDGSKFDMAVEDAVSLGGDRPDPAHYMPLWPEAERTHFMMYETTTEGTPLSPAFATREELARWLVDSNACLYADKPVSYEDWLKVCCGEDVELILSPSI